MGFLLEQLADSVSTVETLLRGRRLTLRAPRAVDSRAARQAARQAAGLAPPLPGAHPPPSTPEKEERFGWLFRVMELAVVMDLEIRGAPEDNLPAAYPGFDHPRASDWLKAAAAKLERTLSVDEIHLLSQAWMAIAEPRATVGVADLEREAAELAREARQAQQHALADRAERLARRIARVGLPAAEEDVAPGMAGAGGAVGGGAGGGAVGVALGK